MERDVSQEESLLDSSPRPFKRRKFYRKRVERPDGDGASSLAPQPNPFVPHRDTTESPLAPLISRSEDEEEGEDDAAQLSVIEIFRQRRLAQRRRAGIEFTTSTSVPSSHAFQTRPIDEVLDNEDSFGKILNVVDRFAPQTGQVADVDKHMMAYIDSELAKRREGYERSKLTSDGQKSDDDPMDDLPADLAKHRQPAALGKLHEIDLGVDATLRNIARTEAAKRRLEGVEPEIEEATGKVRLRRDGKPWRGRRRRNSEDVKRDNLVEEVMKESRRKLLLICVWYAAADAVSVEIYDEPEVEMPNDDGAADDRIAEQFRREFMDAISSRRQKTAQATKKGPGAKVEDKPKGPKLGGSRSARAAMREQQEKAAKK
ncbi:MAG: hypothetical protein Q9170_004065 [Blastenia crenularia]